MAKCCDKCFVNGVVFKSKRWTELLCKVCYNRTNVLDYQKRNRKQKNQYQQDYRKKNWEAVRASEQKYQLNHLNEKKERTARRRAIKKQAMPKWLTLEHRKQIKEIYLNCPVGYEVDHIIPLQGNNVCGLHVPWNLQYLTSFENQSKGNKVA